MMKGAAVLLILAAATTQNVYSKSLPSYLTPCRRKDPNLNKCLLTFLETLLERSHKGIPELYIPPLEPFVIPKIELDQGASKAVTLKSTLNNVSVSGITAAHIEEVKAVMEPEPNFELAFSIPEIRLQSDYLIDGKLLVVPIKGSGKSDVNITDVSGVVKINTNVIEKKGSTYLDVAKRDVQVKVKDAHFYFENLFDGNEELGEKTNKHINENWQELYKELRPVITDAISGIVDHVVKTVLDRYTYDEIFPEK